MIGTTGGCMPNLTVTPQSALLTVGQPITFTARLDGNPAVDAVWMLNPATMGTLVSASDPTASPKGPSVTYVAPPTIAAPQSVAIIATVKTALSPAAAPAGPTGPAGPVTASAVSDATSGGPGVRAAAPSAPSPAAPAAGTSAASLAPPASNFATVSATVALTPDSIVVIPDSASLIATESQRFVAVVASAEPEKVTWILTPPLGELTREDTGEAIYQPPNPVPDNCTVKVIAADRFGRNASATVTLVTKPWHGFGVYLLGIYLFCVFSLTLFLVGLVPARVSNVQDLKTDKADAETALQKLYTQKAQSQTSITTTPPDLQAQIDEATKVLNDRGTALNEATGLEVKTILLRKTLNREVDLLLLVLLAGALGSFLHMAQSFSDFAGNRTLKSSWVWWYALRPFVGAGLALIIYAAIRGSLISAGAPPGFDSTGMNPYGLIAGAALAGLFSKDATRKLGEVFANIFNTEKANPTKDKLLPPSQSQPASQTTAASTGGSTAPVH